MKVKSIAFFIILSLLFLSCRKRENTDDMTPTSPPVEKGLLDLTISHDGIEREYLLYIPASYTGETSVPLVFSLHGAIGTKEKQYELSQFNLIADRENFILVTPEATIPNRVTFWNNESDPNKADDVGFINALIDELSATYNINTERIYAAGSSNGGYMVLQLACELSNRFAAVAAVKGYMNDTQVNRCDPSQPVSIIQMHGTADRNVKYDGVDATIQFWINYNQTNAVPEVMAIADPDPSNGNTAERFLFDNGTDGSAVEHLKIEGGEHDWFGEPGTNYDIDASEEAWIFFSKYDLNGRIN
ncbi:MAG: PHB depolymerase family esterase [Bacteroidota bacterium]